MKIGKYEIDFIETGSIALDGGAMFGIIPKLLWEKTNHADEKNRITLGGRCLILQSESKKILIDSGTGIDWDEKFENIYNLQNKSENILTSLAQKNIQPEEITDVILTHLHFDHVGGSVIKKNGKFEPTFPNAKYFVLKKQFDWGISSTNRDSASFRKERILPLVENGVLTLLEKDGFWDDEIELLEINGHTFGQQMIKISDSKQTLLFCADLIPTFGHIPTFFVMGYDLQPLITIEEKKKYLQKSVDEDWTLVFVHDYFNLGAKVQKTEKGFSVKQLIKNFE
jgi:glyoxylase-like metal-dependent hydrolase (beta-lactamase superfamily II)